MESVRVERTEKEAQVAGGFHHHVAALETDAGARVGLGRVLDDIRLGAATYLAFADGVETPIVIVDACPRCGAPDLATAADTPRRAVLLELPDTRPVARSMRGARPRPR